MRVRAASVWWVACFFLLSCSGSEESETPVRDGSARADRPQQDGDGAGLVCATECPSCQEGYACLTESAFGRLVPTCVETCNSTTDCGPDEKCMLPNGPPGNPSVCVSKLTPATCQPVSDYAHCDHLGTRCRDDNTLQVQVARFGAFCGWELVSCANGCATSTGDAGEAVSRCL